MDRKIIWTGKASADIEAIVRYIGRRNPEAASRIGFGIYERTQILLENPEAGSIVSELGGGRWRKLIYRRWKIVYTFSGDDVVIGRVWPAALGETDLETPL